MAKGLMIWNIVSTAFNLLLGGLSFWLGFKAHKNAQKADLYAQKAMIYEHLDGFLEEYREEEFAHAVNGLWQVYNNQPIGDRTQVEYYRDIIRRNRTHPTSNNAYMQLRTVFDFYNRFASKYIDGVIPSHLLYHFWHKEDLEIIPKILIPLEEVVYEELHGKASDGFPILLKLYDDSSRA